MITMPVARQRRHTLHFLREIRSFAPVFLDTDVDMTAVERHRAAARDRGERYSVVSYVLYAAARAMVAHPEANAAISGRLRPRLARYQTVNGKLALDRTLAGQRVVLSAILPELHRATLADVQERVDHYRAGNPAEQPEFAGVRLLHRLPWPVGAALFRLGVRPLRRRADTFGTFAVSSLGHQPVDGFYSVGGTTITLGLGRITDRPVARAGRVEIARTMRLSLTFDHRVIDGAQAADVLADLKARLEALQPDGEAAA